MREYIDFNVIRANDAKFSKQTTRRTTSDSVIALAAIMIWKWGPSNNGLKQPSTTWDTAQGGIGGFAGQL
jgi:hypothetical protein